MIQLIKIGLMEQIHFYFQKNLLILYLGHNEY